MAENGVFRIEDTEAFKRLSLDTANDLNVLNGDLNPLSLRLFDERLTLDEKTRIVGEAIQCTLLANENRGGYPLDANGIQSFKKDFQHDFGIDIEEYSNAVQNMTFKCFLLSDKMSPYVEPTTDAENRHILRGRPFENDLLRGLLVDQKLGHDATEQKRNREALERRARAEASKISPEAVELRLRIYKIINELSKSTSTGWIAHQAVQLRYQEIHSVQLNKAEFKRGFGVGHALIALKECTNDDLDLSQDHNHTGSIFLKLKQPYEQIETRYKNLLDECSLLPDDDAVAEIYKRFTEQKRPYVKSKKVNAKSNYLPTQNGETSGNIVSRNSRHLSPSPPSTSNSVELFTKNEIPKSRKSMYTTAGEGNFSDSSDSDEDASSVSDWRVEETSPSLSPTKSNDMPNIIKQSNSNDTSIEIKQVEPYQNMDFSNRTVFKQSNDMSTEIKQSNSNHMPNIIKQSNDSLMNTLSNNDNSEIKFRILRAFIYGIMKATFPNLRPISNIVEKCVRYMDSDENLPMTKTEIESFIRTDLRREFIFSSDDAFMGFYRVTNNTQTSHTH